MKTSKNELLKKTVEPDKAIAIAINIELVNIAKMVAKISICLATEKYL